MENRSRRFGRGGGHRGGYHQEGRGRQDAQHRRDDGRYHNNTTWRDRSRSSSRNRPLDNNRQNEQPRRNHDQSRYEKTMGFPYVQKLLNNEDLQEVILQLSNDRNGFTKLLESKNISNDLMVLLIRLLCKVCGSPFQEVKIMIISTALQSRFMDKLILYITTLISQTPEDKLRNKQFWDDPDSFWHNLINLSKTVQEIIPTNCEIIRKLLKSITVFLPLIEEAHSLHIPDEIRAQVSSVLDIVEKTVDAIEVKRQKLDHNVAFPEDMAPPNDFRQIQIIPSVEEIVTDVSPFLRPNIIDRAFNSINQYLDIQFRLLREDFVAPLRRGINTFLKNQSKPRKDWKKLDDIKVYPRIRFLSVETVNESNCFKMQFDFTNKKRSFTYENSKRFMFGSLVCFTKDNFKSLLFGKIVQRDVKLLEQGLLIVGFHDDVIINYDVDYLMVESSVYFEPYYQILGVLQKMNSVLFPMEKYIIRVETDSRPPQYLTKEQPVFYEIENTKFEVLNMPKDQRFYDLNDSQLNAFQAALTEEFCVIQGPPGTGKTFLGLKIAHTLLNNQHAWYNKTPILVICYTNHALDQFLEGILPVTDHILRVGSQSKNENMKQYNLASKRRNLGQVAVHQKRREVRYHMEQIKMISDTLNQIKLNDSLLSFASFEEVVDDYNNTWFASAGDDDIRKWLFEGKLRDTEKARNRNNRRLQDEAENMDVEDNEEKAEDLGDNERNADWLDDILNEIAVQIYKPMLTVQQLKDRLDCLIKELDDLHRQPKSYSVILAEEKIQLEIWETNTDLDYLYNKLALYQDRRKRRRPRRIDLKHPSNMPPEDRWQLYFYWVEQYAAQLRQKYEECSQKFRVIFKVYNDMRDIEDVQIMKRHLVVGMTTTGAARLQSSLQALKSPIVIVEEAAEVLEAHIVAALTSHCQQIILIGDHLQLKPGAADYQIETKFKLGISLFERMVNNNIQCHSLNVQHRMRPEISQLIKPHIYQNLDDHESTLERAPILGIEKSVYFIDHQEPEKVCQDESKKNVHESQFLIALARYLILNGYKPEQITILAAYLGQFYEMVREKKKPNNQLLLQDVRISVLDNYQGEESDIILLSLVRSNAENKAGFLRIQNRVCVALSRARDGFFIVGNMSLLSACNSENQIWEKVKSVLEEQKAIGTHLTLKCQAHPYKFTQVSKSEDFIKLSEGGCDLMCEALLGCGHVCKRLCHVQDRDHKLYNCNEKCTRLLCNDPLHACKKVCYKKCGPCTYLVSRELVCDHKIEIECHIDPNKYKCQELVYSKLPCKHEANKPCSTDPKHFSCPHPCDTRVEPCGHPCDKQCHINMDPDHIKYKCREICAKPKVGCRKSEDNKHICTKFCFQDCESCEVGVKKNRSCGHVFTIPCKVDIEDEQCDKPCKKTLPCGHPCKRQCFEPCGQCKVLVKKTISDCKHAVKIECHKIPSRNDCKSHVCPRLLACGHKCYMSCRSACTDICRVLANVSIQAPCGHTLNKIQCSVQHTKDPEILLKYCTAPCDTDLKCKHKCVGTCGQCIQKRIHIRCAKKCGVPLVCNHECPIPCREACKPCMQPCDMKCVHNKCKKKCGEPCTPCKAPCARKCPHVVCTKSCGLICNKPPCRKKCPKKLKCKHPCVGFCGDPCPPLCRICNKEELTETFFGTEDEKDAVFVLLNDCKHVLEHTGLENWLNEGKTQIQFKTCPKCKTNITTTERYSEYVKKAIQDVIRVKKKSFGNQGKNEEWRRELLEDLLALNEDCQGGLILACHTLGDVFRRLEDRLKTSRNGRRQPINQIELNALKSKIQTLSYIIECFGEDKNNFNDTDKSILHLNLLLGVVVRSEDHVTNQEIDDLEFEIKRFHRTIQLDKIKKTDKFKYAQTDDKVKNLVEKVETTLFVQSRYTDIIDSAVKECLTDLVKQVDCTSVTITDKERMEIVAAMNMAKGHWFKCRNGHPYVIGECGGANQVARCFCGEYIGGTNHHLLPTNQFAGEMDNANRHAWPGGLH